MPSDSGERRPAKAQGYMGSHPPPKLTEPLPCPRCESTSTKFCYYNNYNLAQPRHFCKSCRRYWTHGGALRNVPVGGGTRKASSKRSRPSAAAPSSTTSSSSSSTVTHESESLPVPAPLPANLVSVLPGVKQEMGSTEVNLNESFVPGSETFAPLLSSQGQGFLALGGYGFGLGSGFDELGLGFGRGFWSVPGGAGGYLGLVGGGGCSGGAEEAAAPSPASGCNTWQDNDVEGGGLAGGDCFSWPGLEISMPGKGMK